MRSSQYDEAETSLRQAIAWGKRKELPVKQVAQLHWWLGDLLMNHEPRYEECLQTGLAGMALLDPVRDAHSLEAAMLYSIIAFGYFFRRDIANLVTTSDCLAEFLTDLPYRDELRVSYGILLETLWQVKDQDEWLRVRSVAETKARQTQNYWGLGEHVWVDAYAHYIVGSPAKEIELVLQEACQLFELVGDAKRKNWVDLTHAELQFEYGRCAETEELLKAILPSTILYNEQALDSIFLLQGAACMTQKRWSEAKTALSEAKRIASERDESPAEATVYLGFVALAQARYEQSSDYFQSALCLLDFPDREWPKPLRWRVENNSFFASALYGLECALDDDDTFHAFCREFRKVRPETQNAWFRYWYLQPTHADQTIAAQQNLVTDMATVEWTNVDPSGGAAFIIGSDTVIASPVVRDLLYPLLNAPRLLETVTGDFVLQALCRPAYADRPGVGGLLLWQDRCNYVRLTIGVRAQDEVTLEACIDNHDVTIGRGRLLADAVALRIERRGNHMPRPLQSR